MTNPERETADKQLPDGALLSTEVSDCVALFCTTLTSLNEISLAQMRGLLDIALTAVSAASNLSSFKPGESNKIDQLNRLAQQLRSTAESLTQSLSSLEDKSVADTRSSEAANSDTFCNKVEATLNILMQNSSSLQQQLNTLGQAILAQSAVLLFSVASAVNREGQGT